MAAPPSPTFDALSDSLRPLAQRGVIKRWRKASLLIEEGERGDEIHIILSGRLRVFSRNEREREITYGSYGAGEYVGEMSLDGGPRSASVEAVEPTVCAMVTRQTLHQHIAEHPDFAFELLAKVIGRARAATLTARQLALNDVYGRIKLLLESLAVPRQSDGARLIVGRLTHQEIANRVGSSREMVSRVMKDLSRSGCVSRDRSGLVVFRPLPARW
jgi:CRP/FNR family transcriptional regulator, cyclic AMP receptor protein